MRFCLAADVIGAEQHLSCDGSDLRWIEALPQDAPCVFGDRHPERANCARTLAALNCVPLEVGPPIAHAAAFKLLMKNADAPMRVPWRTVMTKQAYATHLKASIQHAAAALDRCSIGYHRDSFNRHARLFDALRPAQVDFEAFKRAQDAEQAGSNAFQSPLDTFSPRTDGMTRPIAYDRLSTRTGRLTVADGPQILTLKRVHRNVLKSRWPGGSVISLDFASLEARVMLYSVDKAPPAGDLYETISNELFDGKLPRSAIKGGVLALIFGMGTPQLAASLKIDYQDAKQLAQAIRKHFCVSMLERRLIAELKSTQHVRNRHGRVLEVPDEKLIVNTYVQSTGVDVALHGFTNVIEALAHRNLEHVPLYVLHDALILDVTRRTLDAMNDVLREVEHVPGFAQRFPIKVSKFAVAQ